MASSLFALLTVDGVEHMGSHHRVSKGDIWMVGQHHWTHCEFGKHFFYNVCDANELDQ